MLLLQFTHWNGPANRRCMSALCDQVSSTRIPFCDCFNLLKRPINTKMGSDDLYLFGQSCNCFESYWGTQILGKFLLEKETLYMYVVCKGNILYMLFVKVFLCYRWGSTFDQFPVAVQGHEHHGEVLQQPHHLQDLLHFLLSKHKVIHKNSDLFSIGVVHLHLGLQDISVLHTAHREQVVNCRTQQFHLKSVTVGNSRQMNILKAREKEIVTFSLSFISSSSWPKAARDTC